MSDDNDIMGFIEEVPAPAPLGRRGRRAFDDGLAGATRGQTARAAGRKSVARGQYVQMTFRLPDEVVSQLGRMAAEVGVTQEDLKRWLVWRGLQAWEAGERPAVEAEMVRRAKVEW